MLDGQVYRAAMLIARRGQTARRRDASSQTLPRVYCGIRESSHRSGRAIEIFFDSRARFTIDLDSLTMGGRFGFRYNRLRAENLIIYWARKLFNLRLDDGLSFYNNLNSWNCRLLARDDTRVCNSFICGSPSRINEYRRVEKIRIMYRLKLSVYVFSLLQMLTITGIQWIGKICFFLAKQYRRTPFEWWVRNSSGFA